MITMLSNKKVPEVAEVTAEVAALDSQLSTRIDALEDDINTKIAAVFEYRGPFRYLGTCTPGELPEASTLRKNDIIRLTNGQVIQITATGTQLYKVLNDIRAGWVFNLTESCVADHAWIDGYGTTINVNTDVAIVKLDSPVDGCIWGFDAMADALHIPVDDYLSTTSENPVMNRVITEALNEIIPMTTQEARDIIEDELNGGE